MDVKINLRIITENYAAYLEKRDFQKNHFYSRWDSRVPTESVGVNGGQAVAEILHIATYGSGSI